MNLTSVAQSYFKQIRKTAESNYKNLLKVHELAQAAAVDPYGDLDENEKKMLSNLARSIAILADKAYRSGVTGEELRSAAGKWRTQLVPLLVPGVSTALKKDLDGLNNAINSLTFTDIPGSGKGNANEMTGEIPSGKLPQEMQDVVTGPKGLSPSHEGWPSHEVDWSKLREGENNPLVSTPELIEHLKNMKKEELQKVVQALVNSGRLSSEVDWSKIQ